MRKSRQHTELSSLIEATRAGDNRAFTRLVEKYQHFAYAAACGLLNDFDLARDAVQEAFLTAYYRLPTLKDVNAFPAWLNSIVRYSCYRYLRQRRPLDGMVKEMDMQDNSQHRPDRLLEEKERRQYVLNAIGKLPPKMREIVFLFYIENHTQDEVASYLGIRKSTVNDRLHSARQILKRRLFAMVKDTLKGNALPDDFADTIGKIVRVQGPVVEAELGSDRVTSLFDNWGLPDDTKEKSPTFTIIQREVDGRVRLLSDRPSGSVKVKSKIKLKDSEAPQVSSDDVLAEAIAAIAPSSDEKPQVCETGIKIVDLLSPLPVVGCVGLSGLFGVGRAILVMELHHRLRKNSGKLAVFYFVSKEEAINLRVMIDREPNFPPDIAGTVETAWLVTAQATNPDYAGGHDKIDASLFFSPLQSCRDFYPAIDYYHSTSRLLHVDIVGRDHMKTADGVIELLKKAHKLTFDAQFYEYVAMGAYARARQYYKEQHSLRQPNHYSKEEQIIISRARKLELFFTQPFFTTESFTRIQGISASLADTIAGCNAILNGDVDDLPEEVFGFSGNLEDIRTRLKK